MIALRVCLVASLVAAASQAQTKSSPEAFAFDPNFTTLADSTRTIHAFRYSPDGKSLALAHEGGTIDVLDLASRKVTHKLNGHREAVFALCWNHDGTRLASAGADRLALVWDVASEKPLLTLKHPGSVYAIAFHPDGTTLATGGFDKVVRLWDAATGLEKSTRSAHTASIRAVAFSPNGKTLASAGSDYSVRVWDVSGDGGRELLGHTKTVRSIAFVGDKYLASAGDDGRVRIWDLVEGEPIQTLGPFIDGSLALAVSPKNSFLAIGSGNGRIHICNPIDGTMQGLLTSSAEAISAIAISPDGRQLSAGSVDRTVRVWSAIEQTALAAAVFKGHDGAVNGAAVSPDGALLATAGKDGTIRLWDPLTGIQKHQWSAHAGGVEDIAFSSDGRFLVSGGDDRAARLWRVEDRQLIKSCSEHPGSVRRVAISAAGTLLATGSTDEQIRIFRVGTEKAMQKLAAESPVTSLQFLSDDHLLSGGGNKAYLWDVSGARVIDTLDGGQFSRVASVAGARDAKLIVVAGEPATGSLRIEDFGYSRVLVISRQQATTQVYRLHDTGVGISKIAVSSDGRIISAVGGDGSLRVWEWPTLTPIRNFPAHAAGIIGLASSGQGQFVVSASADGTARRWNASRGDPLIYAARLTDESTQAWFALFSPDGKVLATGGDDKTLRLRDGVPGESRSLAGDYPAPYCSAISPDGTLLATGHDDGKITLWNPKTGKPIRHLEGHTFRVWSLAFTSDGTRLVSGGGKWEDNLPGELRVWDAGTWKKLIEVTAHDDLVYSLGISPDGKTIATGGRDNTLRTWDLATGKAGLVIRSNGYLRNLTFSRDGKRIFACGSGHTLDSFDAKTGETLGTERWVGLQVERLAISSDGKTLALASKRTDGGYAIHLWDVENGKSLHMFERQHLNQVNSLAFSPDGKTLISAGGNSTGEPRYQFGPSGPWGYDHAIVRDGITTNEFRPTCELKAWDVENRTPLADLAGGKYWIESLCFTPDGREFISAGGVLYKPGEIRFWSTRGIRPATTKTLSSVLTCAAYSPDGHRLAIGLGDGAVTLVDVQQTLQGDLKAAITWNAHDKLVRCITWSPDGKTLMTAGEEGRVKSWDSTSGAARLNIAAHDRPVYGIAISPDGQTIATTAGSWDPKVAGQIRLWKADGTELFRLPEVGRSVWGVRFTRDGKLLTSHMDDYAMRVFDVAKRKEVRALVATTAGRGLALSLDEKYAGISAVSNGLIKIWETGTWREAFEIKAHPDKVAFTLDFAPDKETIATAGGDGAVVIWKIPGVKWPMPDSLVPVVPTPPGRNRLGLEKK